MEYSSCARGYSATRQKKQKIRVRVRTQCHNLHTKIRVRVRTQCHNLHKKSGLGLEHNAIIFTKSKG